MRLKPIHRLKCGSTVRSVYSPAGLFSVSGERCDGYVADIGLLLLLTRSANESQRREASGHPPYG